MLYGSRRPFLVAQARRRSIRLKFRSLSRRRIVAEYFHLKSPMPEKHDGCHGSSVIEVDARGMDDLQYRSALSECVLSAVAGELHIHLPESEPALIQQSHSCEMIRVPSNSKRNRTSFNPCSRIAWRNRALSSA